MRMIDCFISPSASGSGEGVWDAQAVMGMRGAGSAVGAREPHIKGCYG